MQKVRLHPETCTCTDHHIIYLVPKGFCVLCLVLLKVCHILASYALVVFHTSAAQSLPLSSLLEYLELLHRTRNRMHQHSLMTQLMVGETIQHLLFHEGPQYLLSSQELAASADMSLPQNDRLLGNLELESLQCVCGNERALFWQQQWKLNQHGEKKSQMVRTNILN